MTENRKLVWSDLRDSRVALMLALGFSAGIPLLLVFGTLSVRLREAGIPVTTIGLFSWLALAYSLKFLWSPLVDAIDVPVIARALGRRRAWMVTCQLLIAAALAGVGASDPAKNLAATAAFTFLVAFGSATQDVVIDGWRIDAAPLEKQGLMAAAYQLGYRLAMLCAGAGALYIAQFVDWSSAYFAMAALMGVGLVASGLSPIVDREAGGERAAGGRFDFQRAVKAPIADLHARTGRAIVPILALVALYRLPDFVAGVMSNPLYVDLGFTKTEIATVAKVYGVWIGIAGAFAGGFAVSKAGLYRTMLAGAIASGISHALFAWLSLQGADVPSLVIAISFDNFAGSFAGTALVAYMSGLTGAGFSATQYALLSSLYALPGKLVGGISGFMVTAWGYTAFFAATSAIALPVLALIYVVGRAPTGGMREQEAPGA